MHAEGTVEARTGNHLLSIIVPIYNDESCVQSVSLIASCPYC